MDTKQKRRPLRSGRHPEGETSRKGPPQEESQEVVDAWSEPLAGEKGTGFHQLVLIPGVLRLLQLRPGARVLDLACGHGVVSRALHQQGAMVTGIDGSPHLIEVARRQSPEAIRYQVADAHNLDFLEDASFDAVVFILAAENIDPIEPVWATCARVLRRYGRLVLVVTHPAFRTPRQSRWAWDEERRLLYRAVDSYLSPLRIPIDMRPFRGPGQRVTWTYHRPLQDYITGLAAAGLWVNALEEWPSHKTSRPGPTARAENRARDEFPLFLALRAVQIPGQKKGSKKGEPLEPARNRFRRRQRS